MGRAELGGCGIGRWCMLRWRRRRGRRRCRFPSWSEEAWLVVEAEEELWVYGWGTQRVSGWFGKSTWQMEGV